MRHNDVAVVTNVSADHLGLQGINTIDQLAEVKSTITRITRPQGWDVLNADDPRVLSMRRHATGRAWLFSLDHAHPAMRETLAEGGRATTVLDGSLTWLDADDAHPLVPVVDVPVTLAGISRINLQNAMAAGSAALALGLPEALVARGLRRFVLDPERNPGRTNLFSLDRRLVVIDYAHSPASLENAVPPGSPAALLPAQSVAAAKPAVSGTKKRPSDMHARRHRDDENESARWQDRRWPYWGERGYAEDRYWRGAYRNRVY